MPLAVIHECFPVMVTAISSVFKICLSTSYISCPSCVKMYTMGVTNKRFHHVIDWDKAVPKIISDKYKKKGEIK